MKVKKVKKHISVSTMHTFSQWSEEQGRMQRGENYENHTNILNESSSLNAWNALEQEEESLHESSSSSLTTTKIDLTGTTTKIDRRRVHNITLKTPSSSSFQKGQNGHRLRTGTASTDRTPVSASLPLTESSSTDEGGYM